MSYDNIEVDTSRVRRGLSFVEHALATEPARDVGALVQKLLAEAKLMLQTETPIGEGTSAGPFPHAHDAWRVLKTGAASGAVVNDDDWTEFLFRATGVHVIEPHRPPHALHFFSGGTEIFADNVLHPGTSPNPEMVGTLLGEQAHANRELAAYGAEFQAKLGKRVQMIGE